MNNDFGILMPWLDLPTFHSFADIFWIYTILATVYVLATI